GMLNINTPLGMVDDRGTAIPSQVEPVAFWDDGSVRWIRVSLTSQFQPGSIQKPLYYLTQLAAPQAARSDDIAISRTNGLLSITSRQFRFEFGADAFPQISIDMNGNGTFEASEILSQNPQGTFYARFADGRRGVLTNPVISIEAPRSATLGPVRYAVVKVGGNY